LSMRLRRRDTLRSVRSDNWTSDMLQRHADTLNQSESYNTPRRWGAAATHHPAPSAPSARGGAVCRRRRASRPGRGARCDTFPALKSVPSWFIFYGREYKIPVEKLVKHKVLGASGSSRNRRKLVCPP
jgi:hypothetical protein